jgi:hypothetical protein
MLIFDCLLETDPSKWIQLMHKRSWTYERIDTGLTVEPFSDCELSMKNH